MRIQALENNNVCDITFQLQGNTFDVNFSGRISIKECTAGFLAGGLLQENQRETIL
jgi:hypothetical protein